MRITLIKLNIINNMWLKEFLRIMMDCTISLDSIDNAYQLKDQHLPSKIYKYRGISQHSISNFEDDTVWLCSASNYNDPYECATTWSIEDVMKRSAKNDIERIIEKAALDQHLSNDEIEIVKASDDPLNVVADLLLRKDVTIPEEKKGLIKTTLIDITNNITREMIPQLNQLTQRGMKVCSFSTRIDSVVLWGHYADKHSGFAIEYDVATWPQGEVRRRILYPVIYDDKLFDATKYFLQAIGGRDFNNLYAAIAAIHKSPDWLYEAEWRFVLPMGESAPDWNYPIPKPSAIYLGTKITKANENTLRAIAERKGMAIYKMELSTSEFRLEPKAT